MLNINMNYKEQQELASKATRPTHYIVCWSCLSGNHQLFAVRDEKEKKTGDYVCVFCKDLGRWKPPIENASKKKKHYLDEFEKGELGL